MSSSIESLVNREYQYGFVTDIETDTDSPRAERGHRPPHLGEEERAAVHARVASQGVSPLAHDDGAALGERHVSADRLPGHHLLLGAEEREAAAALDEVDPELLRDVREARHPAAPSRSCSPAWPSTRSSTPCRSARRCKEELAKHGIIFCSFGEAVQRASRARARSISARSCRTATTSSPRSTPRCSATARSCTCRRACAARWSCRRISASTPPTRASSSAR